MNRTVFTGVLKLRDQFSNRMGRARRETRGFAGDLRSGRTAASGFGRSVDSSSRSVGLFERRVDRARRALMLFQRGFTLASTAAGRFFRLIRFQGAVAMFGLTAAMGGVVATGVKFNAQMQSARQSFTLFLGTARRADVFLKQLRELSKYGPFEFTDFTSGAQKLLAFGMRANQTLRTLAAVQDAIAAQGGDPEKVGRTILAIGQIQAKNRIMGEEVLQLHEAGIPASKILRKELGLTNKEVAEIGKQQISAKKALPALVRGMEKLYGGAAVRQSRTLAGQWSTIKDNFAQMSGAIMRPLADLLQRRVLPIFNKIAEKVTTIFEGKGTFGFKAKRTWNWISASFTKWLNSGGEQEIERSADELGEAFGRGLNAIFLGSKTNNPFFRAGRVAVKSFMSGFFDEARIGDIMKSKFGLALQSYMLLKFGPRLALMALQGAAAGRIALGRPGRGGIPGVVPTTIPGGVGGGRRGGGKLPKGIPAGVTPVWVVGSNVPFGGGGPGRGVPGGGGGPVPVPGRRGKGIPKGKPHPAGNPYPAAARRGGRFGRVARSAGSLAKRAAPTAGLLYAFDAYANGELRDPLEFFSLGGAPDQAGGATFASHGTPEYKFQARQARLKAMQLLNMGRKTGSVGFSDYTTAMNRIKTTGQPRADALKSGGAASRLNPSAYLPEGSPLGRQLLQTSKGDVRFMTMAEMRIVAKLGAEEAAKLSDNQLAMRAKSGGIFNRIRKSLAQSDAKNPLEAERMLLGIPPRLQTKVGEEASGRVAKGQVQGKQKVKQAGLVVGREMAAGVKSAKQAAQAAGAAVRESTILGFTGGPAAALAGGGVTGPPSAGTTAAGASPNAPLFPGTQNPLTSAGPTGDAGSGPVFKAGEAVGRKFAMQFAGGMGAGYSAAGAGGGAGSLMFGGDDQSWGGSKPLIDQLVALSGISPSSLKRDRKFTASGGISDHWVGSKNAYAADLPVTGARGDAVAAKLAAALGVPGYTGGSWLNVNRGGYRFQLGWKTKGHFDHVHIGARKLHGGGQFRAPSPGGEGLALLRDREKVIPASGQMHGGGLTIGSLNVKVEVPSGSPAVSDPKALADMVAEVLADRLEAAASNMSFVED